MLAQIRKVFLLGAAFSGAFINAAPTNGTSSLASAATPKHLGIFYCTDSNGGLPGGACSTRDLTGLDLQNIYVGDAFNDQISYIRLDSGTTCTFWMDFVRGPNICSGASFTYGSTQPIENLGNFNSAFNDQISCFACH